jgi:AcrR family transcriptional regulator
MLEGSSNSDQMRRKPQQARSIERVNHILKIADEVFAEMGFEAATTIEIAARAKMSVGSLYRFFPDKAAILKALAGSYLEQLQQVIAQLHTPEAFIYRWLCMLTGRVMPLISSSLNTLASVQYLCIHTEPHQKF